MIEFIEQLAKERPVGTKANTESTAMVERQLGSMGYSIQSLPFRCMVWNKGASKLEVGKQCLAIDPSPFSEPFAGSGKLAVAKTVEQLEGIDCKDAILVLAGEITRFPLQPKDYPFYYPDEHKSIISLLEKKQPKAIVAVTGKTALSGLNPFPLFDDGNFSIPSGNIAEQYLQQIETFARTSIPVHLIIDSHKTKSSSHQKIVKGNEWYAGDHAPFAFRGIPCMAVTSSDLFEGALEHTHTSKDTLDMIDFGMIKSTAQFLIEVISSKLR